jgi:hypothetical protein
MTVDPPIDMKYEMQRYLAVLRTQSDFNKLIIQSRLISGSTIGTLMVVAFTLAGTTNLGYIYAIGITAFLMIFILGIGLIDKYYWNLLIASVEYGEELEKKLKLISISRCTTIDRITCIDGKKIKAKGQTQYIHQKVDEHVSKWSLTIFSLILFLAQSIMLIIYIYLYSISKNG